MTDSGSTLPWNRGGSSQIWKVSPEGGTARQITTGGGYAPQESTDGRYVYYAKGRTVFGLWRVPADGGEEEAVLPRLKPGYWGYWTLWKNSIYFVDKESPRTPAALYASDLRSGKLTRLFDILSNRWYWESQDSRCRPMAQPLCLRSGIKAAATYAGGSRRKIM